MTTIEIKGTGFINKGAELMHHAIVQKITESFSDIKIAMAPDIRTAPYHNRALLGHYQKLWFDFYGFQLGYLGPLIPQKHRTLHGIILDKDIDVVLDASGFAYSDQFGDYNAINLSKACKRWRRQGTRLILLPQALGPFTSIKIKEAIKIIVEHADLIFARDRISYENITSVTGARPNIHVAPDFTNLIQGIAPENFEEFSHRICIIPNDRMIEKTTLKEGQAYISFLTTCIKYLHDTGRKPFFLIHEGSQDIKLALSVRKASLIDIPIINESNPLKIKGIIGACHSTIGSRFHGLVSALSQCIPSIATGWSHKYKMLFDDYDFSTGLININASHQEIIEKINLLFNESSYAEIKNKLDFRSKILKTQSMEMWADVIKCIMSINS